VTFAKNPTLADQRVAAGGGGAAGAGPVIAPLYHDTTHAPTALYQLDGSLVDTSGFGRPALTADTITPPRFTTGLTDDHLSMWFRLETPGAIGTRLSLPALDSAFARLTGALTAEILIWPQSLSLGGVMSCFAGGETEADNILWAIDIPSSTDYDLRYNAESGAGIDITFASFECLTPGRWNHCTLTRNSAGTVVRFYRNGYLVATSGALTAPTGGGNGSFFVGYLTSGSNLAPNAAMCSVKFIPIELTAAQVLAEAQRTLGNLGWAP
jgi:hypothetical protein